MELIITTKEDLREFLRTTFLEEILPNLSVQQLPKPERLPINKAVEYLGSEGFITTKATLYSYVSKNTIPHKKINGKVIFERKELDGWLRLNLKKHN